MGQIVFQATLGGQVAVAGPNTASSFTLTLPAATDTLVGKATTDTLTNKSISGSTNTLTNIANASLTNSSVTIGSTAISLGGTSTTLVGLTGITSSAITDSGLTSGRVTFAGASGLLVDSASLVFNGTSLGIGTSSPEANAKLTVYGSGVAISRDSSTITPSGYDLKIRSASPKMGLHATAASQNMSIEFSGGGGANALLDVQSGDGLVINTNATERMRITSAGNVGIGTSSPSYVLDVAGIGRLTTAVNSNATSLILNNSNTAAGGVGVSIDGYSSNTSNKLAQIVFGGAGATGGNIDFLTSANGSSYVQQMRLDTSGNLGLGVTPSAWDSTFTVLQDSTAVFAGRKDGSAQAWIGNNWYYNSGFIYKTTGLAAYYLQNGAIHSWHTAPSGTAGNTATFTQAMTLDASGNLLVGTTNTTKTNTGFRVESGVANTSRASTGSFFEFYDTGSGSRIGYISNSGGVATLYNTTSDQRLKTNIVNASSGNIDDIKVRSFDWIVNGSHQPYGMVAQELIEVAPYAVNKPENPDEMMAVDYSKLVPMMIKEIQDLKQRIATLENK